MGTFFDRLHIKNSLVRECLAEFLGTFILLVQIEISSSRVTVTVSAEPRFPPKQLPSSRIFPSAPTTSTFGDGSVAQMVLSKGELGSALSIHWSWGIGVMLGIYVAGGVSGAHLNPAVTVAQASLCRISWKKVVPYMLAQYAGAFMASACVYLVYYDALNHFDGGIRQVGGDFGTAGIWSTYPQTYVSTWNCFGDQVFSTALLLICILAITDPRNMQPTKGVTALSVGLVVVVIGMTFGLNCGYAINPARDLGPRIFTAVGGWGSNPFTYRDYNYFWVPVIGPHLGGVLGAFVYQLCVGLHWPREDQNTHKVPIPKKHVYNGPYASNTHM